MPRNFFGDITQGTRAAGAAIAGGPGTRARGYRSEVADLANADYLNSRADLARAQAQKAQQANLPENPEDLMDAISVSQNIPVEQGRAFFKNLMGKGTPDPTSNPSGDADPHKSGLDPALEKALSLELGNLLVQKHLTGKTNFEQFQGGRGKQVQTDALRQALDGVDTDDTATFSRKATIGTGHTVAPFRTNPQGTVIDEQTGELDESGQLAEAMRDLTGAKQAKEESHSDLYDAQKDKADAVKTGRPTLDTAKQRDYNFWRKVFPNDSEEETFRRTVGGTDKQTAELEKNRRKLMDIHPRWSMDQINAELARAYRPAEGAAASDAGVLPPPVTPAPAQIPRTPSGLPPGSQYSPSRQQWRDPKGKLYDATGKPL